MTSALMYLGICLLGYLAAIPLRKHSDNIKWFGKAQTVSVLCLVFAMGIRVGANRQVVTNLDSYGLYSFIFTVVVLIFSVLVLHFARKILRLDRYGIAETVIDCTESDSSTKASEPAKATESNKCRGPIIDRMTAMIVICVALGISSGYFILLGAFGQETVASASGLAITIGLCVLLLFVGLDLGLEGKVFANIRKVGLKILLLPVAVAVGTLIGSVLCSFFLPLALNESLAVGGGFAWYSMAAGIIMDAGYEAAGAISFMHNVMRELMGIIFVPMVARRFGYVECLALPASTCMDVCLPIVEQSTNSSTAVYSFITGFALSMSVPLLVPLFLDI